MTKKFEEMNQVERFIHNSEFNLKVHREALAKMETDGTPYTVQLTIIDYIKKEEAWLKTLEAKNEAGETEI